jgi:HEAT repeat protein
MSALNDADPVVRVTAAHAVEALPSSDASAALIPLLTDKQEVVRREAAHALGATHSRTAVQPLIELLNTDKEGAVRAAAAMALGEIRDEAAVVPLANALTGGGAKKKKSKTRENEFVLREAARSLGQIRSRAGVAALVETLNNDANPIDVRRAAAEALGAIGDPTAAPALKTAVESTDPYLAQTARASLRRLH